MIYFDKIEMKIKLQERKKSWACIGQTMALPAPTHTPQVLFTALSHNLQKQGGRCMHSISRISETGADIPTNRETSTVTDFKGYHRFFKVP